MAHLRPDMCKVLTSEIIDSLNRVNIWTVNDLLSVKNLMDLKHQTSVKYHILKEVHDSIKQKYTLPCHDMNYVLEKSLEICEMCPTGIPVLTAALEGGFQTQEIVEFFGETECGKTELCHLIVAEFLLHFDDFKILYIDSNHTIDHKKLVKYLGFKAQNRKLSDDDITGLLSRVQVARPTKLSDMVHLLNTSIHSDKSNTIKCIIIDSLSLIIHEEVLEIRTSNLDDGTEVQKFVALKTPTSKNNTDNWSNVNNERKYLADIHLHEVMKLLNQIALIKNVIIIVTNSDPNLATSKSWINSIDHRIQLRKMTDFSRYVTDKLDATVLQAIIIKTIHNITKLGYSIPFIINDQGIVAIQAKESEQEESQTIPSSEKASGSQKS